MAEKNEAKEQVCDICHWRPVAFRVTVVEDGRRKTLNVCREDYQQLRAQRASPVESLFGGSLFGDEILGDFLDDGLRRSSGRSTPRRQGQAGRDREAVDVGETRVGTSAVGPGGARNRQGSRANHARHASSRCAM